MGRRALPKIPAHIDYAQYLLELESLQPPLETSRIFPQWATLEIEVGSGKGLFLVSSATANPDRHYLASKLPRSTRDLLPPALRNGNCRMPHYPW